MSTSGNEYSSSVLNPPSNEPTGLVPSYSSLFFGSLLINADEDVAPQVVKITNVGSSDVGILSVKIATGQKNFRLAGNTVYPKVLRAGESFNITVAVSFDDIGQLAGTIQINTNEDRLPYTIGLGGRVIGGNYFGDDAQQEIIEYVNTRLTATHNEFNASLQEERWARADADSAEAGYRLTLQAQLRGETEARVMQEYIARVTAFEAEALARLTLDARVGQNSASVEDTKRAFANLVEAEALARQELQASVNNRTDALLVNERSAYATKFLAVATESTQLEARVKGYTDAQVLIETQARATAIEAEASARRALAATFGGSVEAKLTEEVIARINAQEAEVIARQNAIAEFGKNVDAKFASERTATANAIEALATRTETLEAEFESGEFSGVDSTARAAITEEASVRASAIEAEATARQVLSASINDEVGRIDTRISNEATASANRDGALASRIETLEATYDPGGGGDGSGVDPVARSMVQNEATTRANEDEALASRIETVEASYQNAGQVGAIATAKAKEQVEAVATALSAEVIAREALAATLRTESATNIAAAITSERAVRVNAEGALSTRIDTQATSYRGAGNRVPDSEFQVLDGWTLVANSLTGITNHGIDAQPDWALQGDPVLGIDQQSGNVIDGSGGTHYYELQSPGFVVAPSEFIQFYVMSASHRCDSWMSIFFYGKDGANVGYAGDHLAARFPGGADINNWYFNGRKFFQVPANAVSAKLIIRKWGTSDLTLDGHSISWFSRPYVGSAVEGQTQWNPYSVGSAKNSIIDARAKITAEELTRAAADGALATRALTLEAQMAGTQDSVLAARVREEATARTNADGALAIRANTLEAQIAGTSESGLKTTLSGSIAAVESARVSDKSAIVGRANVLEAQMRGESSSALQTLIKESKKNLADVSWWKKDAPLPWAINEGRENQIYSLPDSGSFVTADGPISGPFGSSADVWLARATDSGGAAGGWNAGKFVTPLDPDKTYRFAVPIMGIGLADRIAYWGTNGVCDLNTGNTNDNPYFASLGINTLALINRWFLFVGYVFPRNSIAKTHDGAGVFDLVTGEKIIAGMNYCFHPDGNQITHRAYQFYADDGAYQAFGRPMVELVDGTESPLTTLLGSMRKVNARVTAEESARVGADAAIGTRIESVVTTFNAANVTTNTRIANEETARSNADGALGTRISTIEASYINSGTADAIAAAKVAAEAVARANADGALASDIATVSAAAGGAAANASIAMSAASDAKTALANARIELVAGSPGGRASVTIKSDSNGGAGIDLGGDVTLTGGLNIVNTTGNGTLRLNNTGLELVYPNGVVAVSMKI